MGHHKRCRQNLTFFHKSPKACCLHCFQSNVSHPNINMWYITPSRIFIFLSWGHAVLKCWGSAMVSWKNIVPEVMTCSNVSWSNHETQTTALISIITSICLYALSMVNCMSQTQNNGWLKELECVYACVRAHVCVCVCTRAHLHTRA